MKLRLRNRRDNHDSLFMTQHSCDKPTDDYIEYEKRYQVKKILNNSANGVIYQGTIKSLIELKSGLDPNDVNNLESEFYYNL